MRARLRGIAARTRKAQQFRAERHRHLMQSRIAPRASQISDGFGHLDRIARGIGQRFVHVGQKRGCAKTGIIGDIDEASRQGPRIGLLAHEGAGAHLHIEHQGVEAGSQFLGRIEAVMSGSDSTVAVTSRMA